MKITVNEKIDLRADRKKDQFLADMKKAHTANGWKVVDDGWASEGEIKGVYSTYCSEESSLPDITDSHVEAVADIIRKAVEGHPVVQKYKDYVKTDTSFDGAVYVTTMFEPTEELWKEDLEDAEYVWKKVADAISSVAARYRGKEAELDKKVAAKSESKKNEKVKDRGCWFVLKGVDEQEVYDWFSDHFVDADVVTYDPDPVGGSDDDECGIQLDATLTVDQAWAIFEEYGEAIEEFAINEPWG